MSDAARHLLEEALRLPHQERAELVSQLLHSLDEDDFGPPDAGYDEAWAKEIERRLREVQDGTEKLVDGETALAALRAKYRK